MERIGVIVVKNNDNYIVCYEGDEKCLSDMYSIIKEEIESSVFVVVDKEEYSRAKKDIQRLNELLKSSIE